MSARIAVIMTVLASLAAAPAALAGGWATVELSSTPDQAAGGTWNVDVSVLQHGRTPLTGVEPAIVIRSGGQTQRFAAKPTGKPGVYRAEVVFPRAGTWRYVVDDGFGQRHTYPPAEIGEKAAAPAPPAPDDGSPWPAILLASLAGVAAAGVAFALQRRRRIPHAEA